MAKGAKAKKEKGGKGAGPDRASVANHPTAATALVRLKAWAGLLGAGAVAVASLRAGVPPFETVARALIAGMALYLVAWAAGVTFFRQLVVAELRAEADRRAEERARRDAQLRAEAEAVGAAAG
jgi:hypothetical protein